MLETGFIWQEVRMICEEKKLASQKKNVSKSNEKNKKKPEKINTNFLITNALVQNK